MDLPAASADRPRRGRRRTGIFEKKIRPVFVQHCYECHSTDAKKLGGGLLLDSRQGLRTGGDSGAAILADAADQSLLLQALRYDGDIQMPPKGKLPAEVIADFEVWLKLGAPIHATESRQRVPSRTGRRPSAAAPNGGA